MLTFANGLDDSFAVVELRPESADGENVVPPGGLRRHCAHPARRRRDANPGVDHTVENVHDQIHADVDEGAEQDERLHHGEILPKDGVDDERADTGPVEDFLDEHAAGDELGEQKASGGDRGKECVRQGVPRKGGPAA